MSNTLPENDRGPLEEFITVSREAFHAVYQTGKSSSASRFDTKQLRHISMLPALARRHRIMGLLEAGLNLGDYLPVDDTAAWKASVFGQARHASSLALEAEQLYHHLEGRVGGVMLVKGPVLALQAWPDLGLRSFDDLDFRVPKGAYDLLLEAMHDLNYQPVTGDDSYRAHLWHFGWGIAFRNEAGGMLEFNHRFFPPHYPVPRGFHPGAQSLATFLKLDHYHVRTLTPAAHLMYACMHALWHGWERLAWLVDIAGLMVRHPSALEEAEAMAGRSSFALHALHTGVCVAENMFGPGILHAAVEETALPAIERAWQIVSAGKTNLTFDEQRDIHREIMTRTERQLYDVRRALIPGDGDFRAFRLPRKCGSLYWALRPLRLAKEHYRARRAKT